MKLFLCKHNGMGNRIALIVKTIMPFLTGRLIHDYNRLKHMVRPVIIFLESF